MTGLGIILAYNLSRKRTGSSALLGRFGALPFQILIACCSLLATVGAVSPCNMRRAGRIAALTGAAAAAFAVGEVYRYIFCRNSGIIGRLHEPRGHKGGLLPPPRQGRRAAAPVQVHPP